MRQQVANSGSGGSGIVAIEKHYTVPEVAKAWGLTRSQVLKIFQDRAVLDISPPKAKRRHFRIPESLLQAVHAERSRRWNDGKPRNRVV